MQEDKPAAIDSRARFLIRGKREHTDAEQREKIDPIDRHRIFKSIKNLDGHAARSSTMQTKNLTLIPHLPRHLLALIESPEVYHKTCGTRVVDGVREFLLAASPEFLAQLRLSTVSDPWKFGFAIVHRQENLLIGLCGFTGPPDPDGAVEIAYSIAPNYQGKGYATEAAIAIVDYALNSDRVKTVCAHTLPEFNASTRVLEKCGFKRIGEIVDPERNLVWRWEKNLMRAVRSRRSTITS